MKKPARGIPIVLHVNFGEIDLRFYVRWSDPEPVVPDEDSAGYWLTHHDLGVGRGRDGAARSYEVEHLVWALHEVRSLEVAVDFGALYGPQWAFLGDAEPSHVTLAEGSGVAITPAVDAWRGWVSGGRADTPRCPSRADLTLR